ncbi:glyoxalase superfamily protein [Tritonibacter horizontis]|uniref:Bleomycin resistance protein n=1 Tax=Tritonibacter horizontis TaxID=1768241 RepID=A0A132BVK4_9RHOB|nr:glyoxalase superfamily protein [Tritonibacter horizontis]KUP92324.1 bleomycin resistance protein [Tritonibacter horizontis]
MSETSDLIALRAAIPVIRIFDEAKALEFYVDYLGFTVDWSHRFEADLPIYLQVSRAGCLLHLSGHHGDATPGSTSFVPVADAAALHRELAAKAYPHLRPGLDEMPWGLQITVTDPFGNRLRFCEQRSAEASDADAG